MNGTRTPNSLPGRFYVHTLGPPGHRGAPDMNRYDQKSADPILFSILIQYRDILTICTEMLTHTKVIFSSAGSSERTACKVNLDKTSGRTRRSIAKVPILFRTQHIIHPTFWRLSLHQCYLICLYTAQI